MCRGSSRKRPPFSARRAPFSSCVIFWPLLLFFDDTYSADIHWCWTPVPLRVQGAVQSSAGLPRSLTPKFYIEGRTASRVPQNHSPEFCPLATVLKCLYGHNELLGTCRRLDEWCVGLSSDILDSTSELRPRGMVRRAGLRMGRGIGWEYDRRGRYNNGRVAELMSLEDITGVLPAYFITSLASATWPRGSNTLPIQRTE